MADFNSSLPVRTQNNGDVVAQISDGTTPSQKLAVDSTGRIIVKLDDAAGNGITSTTIVAKQALDVNVANAISATTGIADESTFTYGTSLQQPMGGVFNTAITPLTSGQSGALSVTANRDLRVNLRTSAGIELGNSAATKFFVQSTDGTNSQSFTAAGEAKVSVTTAATYGSVAAGTAATVSTLTGGVFNTALPTLTTGQQAAIQLDSSGRQIIAPLTSASSVSVSNLPTTVDTNFGVVGASTIRTASELGNSTGAADFNSGATSAQTIRVVANQGAANATPWNQNISQVNGATPSATNALPAQLTTAGAFVSSTNPLPVIIDPAGAGTTVNDYKDAASIAAGSSDAHLYTATGTTGFRLQQVYMSASGKAKCVVAIETGVATGVYTTIFATFNSTATPYAAIPLPSPVLVATGVRVQVTMSNTDLLAQDLYSTISGFTI